MECQLEGISVHYTVYGDGRPLVSLHGFGPDQRSMIGCMEPIFQQRKGWKRLYPDLPGMGRTPGKDWITNSDRVLDVVLSYIDAVIPAQHFVLAGDSYGGYLARGIVHRAPERVDGLLLICPMIVADSTERALPPHVTLVRDSAYVSSTKPEDRKGFESFAVVATQRTWQRTQEEVEVGFEAADEAFLSRLQSQGYAFSFDVDTGAVPFDRPTLILVGRQDGIVGYRDAWEILENYPRATFAVLDRAGHNLQIEQEELFNTFVGEWLDRVEEHMAFQGQPHLEEDAGG
jgi:pimeloyl-ACP methyl ester carboxylesterase